MLLLRYIIAVTAILSASAQTTFPSSRVSTTKSLGKTSSPSTTSVAHGSNAPSAPQPTGSPNNPKETRKLGENFELALLKDVRENMTFLPYTPEERVFVAQQRQETLNITMLAFYAMARHALSLRDLHTNFLIGGQHSCYLVGTPYDLDFVTSEDIVMNPRVVVRAVSQNPEYNALFPPEVFAIKPGDRLDTIDGKSFRDYWISVQNLTGGGKSVWRVSTGPQYAIETICRQLSIAEQQRNRVWIYWPRNGKFHHFESSLCGSGEPNVIHLLLLFLHQMLRDPIPGSPVLYTTYKARDFTMGVVRLNSFQNNVLLPAKVLDVIRTLLTDTLSNTDGILFDVRGNGGGQVLVAESIYQCIASDQFRAERLALQHAAPTDKMTKPINMDGHAYLRPVAVLTDGQCYSACDFLCAGMQDNGAAIIFGEDPQTGAGGANVFDHATFLRELAPAIFKPLPFEGSLGNDANNKTIPVPGTGGMRVAIRQAVRIGRNAGKLLEDAGVKVDKVIRQTTAELTQTQGDVFPQFKRIAMRLKQQAAKDGRSKLRFQSPFGLRFLTNFAIPFNAKRL
ncbi:ClpP/crotonase-like domain-containing protein [Phlyctochytrium arcticum]|nr:ClpP/crotonase-like domain-containing protein [Phlyctochytrium arcticum]